MLGKQQGKYIVSGISTFDRLNEIGYVNAWSSSKTKETQGMQREPVKNHYIKLAKSLDDGTSKTWLPTPIVLSTEKPLKLISENSKTKFLVSGKENIEISILDSDIQNQIQHDKLVRLSVPLKSLSIVDGQHRIKAIEYLIIDKNKEKYRHIELPYIIMFPQSKLEEIVTFIDLNSKGKRVKTDLANQLLLDINKHDGSYISTDADIKKMISTKVANLLNEDIDSSWYKTIAIGSQINDYMVSSTTWVSSLRTLYSIPSVKSKYEHLSRDVDEMAGLLKSLVDKYWKVLYRLEPSLFPEGMADKKRLVIQKTVGTSIMNQVFIGILDKFITDPIQHISEEKLFDFLNEYLEKEEYLTTDFWESSDKRLGIMGGRASSHSSEKGFKELSQEILSSITDNYYAE